MRGKSDQQFESLVPSPEDLIPQKHPVPVV